MAGTAQDRRGVPVPEVPKRCQGVALEGLSAEQGVTLGWLRDLNGDSAMNPWLSLCLAMAAGGGVRGVQGGEGTMDTPPRGAGAVRGAQNPWTPHPGVWGCHGQRSPAPLPRASAWAVPLEPSSALLRAGPALSQARLCSLSAPGTCRARCPGDGALSGPGKAEHFARATIPGLDQPFDHP